MDSAYTNIRFPISIIRIMLACNLHAYYSKTRKRVYEYSYTRKKKKTGPQQVKVRVMFALLSVRSSVR